MSDLKPQATAATSASKNVSSSELTQSPPSSGRPVATAKVTTTVALSDNNIAKLAALNQNDALQKAVATQQQQDPNTSRPALILAKLAINGVDAQSTAPLPAALQSKTLWALLDTPISKHDTVLIRQRGQALSFSLLPADSKQIAALLKQLPNALRNTLQATAHSSPLSSATGTPAPQLGTNAQQGSSTQIQPLITALQRRYLPLQDLNLGLLKQLNQAPSSANHTLIQRATQHSNPLVRQLAIGITQQQSFNAGVGKITQLNAGSVQNALVQSGIALEQYLKAKPHSGNLTLQTTDAKTLSLSMLSLAHNLTTHFQTQLGGHANTGGSDLGKDNAVLQSLLRVLLGPQFDASGQKSRRDQSQQKGAEKLLGALRALEQLATGTLARISSNQTASIQAQNDNQSLQLVADLPFRGHETLVPVHIQLFDYRKRKEEASRGKKPRQWRLLFEWQFEQVAHFSAELIVEDDALSASIATDNLHIRQQLKKNMHALMRTLEDEDITIRSLLCKDQPPEAIGGGLHTQHCAPYSGVTESLIDIKT